MYLANYLIPQLSLKDIAEYITGKIILRLSMLKDGGKPVWKKRIRIHGRNN